MTKTIIVSMSQELLENIFEAAKRLYPKETILLLRGKKSKDQIRILELVIPPLATYGHGFASYPFHMLPMDFSLVGSVHSHPSGNKTPSDVDFNHFFGRILMIAGYPYNSQLDIVAYNSHGEKIPIQIIQK